MQTYFLAVEVELTNEAAFFLAVPNLVSVGFFTTCLFLYVEKQMCTYVNTGQVAQGMNKAAANLST
jgi:hypothetical protein